MNAARVRSYSRAQSAEKRLVTPAKAGVQKNRIKRINPLLDTGLRRHDETMVIKTVAAWIAPCSVNAHGSLLPAAPS